jgi:hypothetical protein
MEYVERPAKHYNAAYGTFYDAIILKRSAKTGMTQRAGGRTTHLKLIQLHKMIVF